MAGTRSAIRFSTLLLLLFGLCLLLCPAVLVMADENDLSVDADAEGIAEDDLGDDDDDDDDDDYDYEAAMSQKADIFAAMFDPDNDDMIVPNEVRSDYIMHETHRREDFEYLLHELVSGIDAFGNKDGKTSEDEIMNFHSYFSRQYIEYLMGLVKDERFDKNEDGKLDIEEIDEMLDGLVAADNATPGLIDQMLVYRFDEDGDDELDEKEYAALKEDEWEVEEAVAESKDAFVDRIIEDFFEGGKTLSASKWNVQIENERKDHVRYNALSKEEQKEGANGIVAQSLCTMFAKAKGSLVHYDQIFLEYDKMNWNYEPDPEVSPSASTSRGSSTANTNARRKNNPLTNASPASVRFPRFPAMMPPSDVDLFWLF